jgi:hypothetical protein
MLEYTLSNNTLNGDATNATDLQCGGESGEDSLGDCYYFAVGLLDVAGYWNSTNQFWTDAPHQYPHNTALCIRLRQTLATKHVHADIGLGAERILAAACPF